MWSLNGNLRLLRAEILGHSSLSTVHFNAEKMRANNDGNRVETDTAAISSSVR
jgi:hypothetical protein